MQPEVIEPEGAKAEEETGPDCNSCGNPTFGCGDGWRGLCADCDEGRRKHWLFGSW